MFILGWTPLHYAAHHDRVTYARMLCMRGASQSQDDKKGKSPLSIAQEKGNQTFKYFNKEIKDEDLEGIQPADIQSINEIKESFGEQVEAMKSRIGSLQKKLHETDSIEEANKIFARIRLVRLSLCYECTPKSSNWKFQI